MNRTKKALKIIFGSVMNQIAIVVIGLILPPLIIKNYGSATNGLINSVKQMLNYFTVFSVGLGAAGQIALYKPLAEGNEKMINKIMSELNTFFKKMSFVLCCVVLLIAVFFPMIRNDGISYETIFSIVLICGLGSIIEFLFLQKYKILLTADQKQYISSAVNTQGLFANLFFSIILIRIGVNIIIVQLMATLAYVLRACLMLRKIKKLYPFLNLDLKNNNKVIHNQKSALIYKLSDVIISYAPMTIITLMFGFEDASVYSVYNTIFLSIGMIVSIFSSGFSSLFGNMIVSKENDKLVSSFIGYNFGYRLVLFWLYSCAAILILPFVSIYIHNNDGVNYLIPSLGILFAVSGLFKNIRMPSYTIVDSYGKYTRRNILMNYIEVIINIVVAIIASLKFGIVGVLIGCAVSSIFRSIVYIYDVYSENLKISYISEFFKLMLNIALFAVLYKYLYIGSVDNVWQWIYSAIIVSLVCGFGYLILNVIIDKRGRKELFLRIKNLLPRRK